MEKVEGYVRRGRGGVEPDGNGDQPERDRPRAQGVGRHGLHDSTLLPMMRAGMGSPTDSVPAPVERQHVGVLTALSALILVAFIAVMAWLQYGGSRMEAVEEPERGLAPTGGRAVAFGRPIAAAAGGEGPL